MSDIKETSREYIDDAYDKLKFYLKHHVDGKRSTSLNIRISVLDKSVRYNNIWKLIKDVIELCKISNIVDPNDISKLLILHKQIISFNDKSKLMGLAKLMIKNKQYYFWPLIVGVDMYLRSVNSINSVLEIDYDKNSCIKYFKEFVGSGWTIFDRINEWPEGLVLAGGSVISCLYERKMSDIEDAEDLDFWITGPSKNIRRNTLKQAINFITENSKTPVVYSMKGCTITMATPGDNRNIQLVLTKMDKIYDLLNVFDLPQVRAGFDGKTMYIGIHSYMFLKIGILHVDLDKIKTNRFIKLLRFDTEKFKINENHKNWVIYKQYNTNKACKEQRLKIFKSIDPKIADIYWNKYVRVYTSDKNRMEFEVSKILGGDVISNISAGKLIDFIDINNIYETSFDAKFSQYYK